MRAMGLFHRCVWRAVMCSPPVLAACSSTGSDSTPDALVRPGPVLSTRIEWSARGAPARPVRAIAVAPLGGDVADAVATTLATRGVAQALSAAGTEKLLQELAIPSSRVLLPENRLRLQQRGVDAWLQLDVTSHQVNRNPGIVRVQLMDLRDPQASIDFSWYDACQHYSEFVGPFGGEDYEGHSDRWSQRGPEAAAREIAAELERALLPFDLSQPLPAVWAVSPPGALAAGTCASAGHGSPAVVATSEGEAGLPGPVRTIATAPGGGLMAYEVALRLANAVPARVLTPQETLEVVERLGVPSRWVGLEENLRRLREDGVDAWLHLDATSHLDSGDPLKVHVRLTWTGDPTRAIDVTWMDACPSELALYEDCIRARGGARVAAREIVAELERLLGAWGGTR